MLSVLIAGGGTGGHLYPGIAVARELLARVPDAQVTFVGTAAGIEARVIPREGFPLEVIRSAGLKGKSIGALAARRWRCCRWARSTPALRHRRTPAVGGDRRRRVQLGSGRGAGGAARHSDAADGAERDARADQSARWRRFVKAAAVTYEESGVVLRQEGVRRGQSGSAGVLRDSRGHMTNTVSRQGRLGF